MRSVHREYASALHIDGSHGEGGGQILRSSLALAIMTGKPFRIDNIRAKRKKSGLMRQHLTAVQAATQISGAETLGAAIGSSRVDFTPGAVAGGEYTFSIGTAGSTTLVLQTVLLPLALADRPSRVVLEGGTHNPFAPPFDFLDRVYIPLLNRMGARVSATLERPGFYPAGGGRIVVEITPAKALSPLELGERGALKRRHARAVVSNLPRDIAERELDVVRRKLEMKPDEMEVVEVERPVGPGNIVTIEVEHEHARELFTGFGEVGRSANRVAGHAVQQCQRYLHSEAVAGEYLTDQLMLPLAMAGGGLFRSVGMSRHAETHAELIGMFTNVRVDVEPCEGGGVLVRLAT